MHVQPAPLCRLITDPLQRVVGSERPNHCRDVRIANAVATETKRCHHHHRRTTRECTCAEQRLSPALAPHPLRAACGHADRSQRAVRRKCPSQRGRALVPNRVVIQIKLPQRTVGHERIRQHRRTRGANPIATEIELLAATRGVGAQREREMSTMSVRATWAAPTQAPDAAQTPVMVRLDASTLAMAAAPHRRCPRS